MNIVLIVMLFILFFLTLQGWRKGILGIVYGLVSWIFIFIFVSVANPYILGYLKTETNIYDKVYEQAEKFVTNKAENLPQDPDALAAALRRVTKEDVRQAAAAVTPDTVCTLEEDA